MLPGKVIGRWFGQERNCYDYFRSDKSNGYLRGPGLPHLHLSDRRTSSDHRLFDFTVAGVRAKNDRGFFAKIKIWRVFGTASVALVFPEPRPSAACPHEGRGRPVVASGHRASTQRNGPDKPVLALTRCNAAALRLKVPRPASPISQVG